MNDTAAPDSTVPTTAGAPDSSASTSETTAPETGTGQGGSNAASTPARPFATSLPSNLRVLFHLPPQRKGYTGKINNSFLYSDKFGRIDKYGRHFWDNPGMHVFEGRLLTMEEFLQPRVQRYLLEDHWTTPVQVRLVTVEDGTVAVSVAESKPAEGMPSKDDVRAMLTEMDRLRAAVQAANTRIDELEVENTTFRNAIDQIEKGAAGNTEETTGSPDESPKVDASDIITGSDEESYAPQIAPAGNPVPPPDAPPPAATTGSPSERRGPGRPRGSASKN